jgi:hypothetical protein
MNVFEAMMEKGQDSRWGVLDDGTVNYTILLTQWHFAKRNIFTGKVAWNSYLTHGLRHNCVIDQSVTENKVIHTLIIDFFSHGLRSVKIEQELEKNYSQVTKVFFVGH